MTGRFAYGGKDKKGEEWETEVQNGRKKKIKRKRECKDVFNEKKI